MGTRLKVVCQEVGQRQSYNKLVPVVYHVKLMPVHNGSEENKKFFEATPNGVVEFSSINPEAGKQFEVGKEYFVDIHPAT